MLKLLSIVALLLQVSSVSFADSAPSNPAERGEIIFIGDSQATGSFGTTLHSLMQRHLTGKSGESLYDVHSTFECASNPATWTRSIPRWQAGVPNFCGLMTIDGVSKPVVHDKNLAEILPDLQSVLSVGRDHAGLKVAVIEQGSNMLRNDAAFPAQFPGFAELMHEIDASGFRCVWIGPPHPGPQSNEFIQFESVAANASHPELPGRNAQLKSLVESHGCAYIDSSDLADRSEIPAADMHCTGKCGVKWAQAVFSGPSNPTKLEDILLKWADEK